MSNNPRKLVAEWRDEIENVRIELDLEINRISIWRLRHGQDDSELYETNLDQMWKIQS